MAKLYYRYGAMGASKTSNLIGIYWNYKVKEMEALIFKPSIDTKGGGNLIARDGRTIECELITQEENILEIVTKKIVDGKVISCILVDEAQFLQPEQVEQLADIVDVLNIPVICYGLRADFQTHLFPGSKRLLEIADTIEEVKTVCDCGKKAIMNTRKLNDEYVFEGEQVAIDGEAKVTYNALCRKCYNEAKRKVLKAKKI